MDTVTFSRGQLYDLVWSKSILSLSSIYNVPQVALRNACIKNGIPLPRQGYWEKIKAGHRIDRPTLSNTSTIDQVINVKKSGQPKSRNEPSLKITVENNISVRDPVVKSITLDPLIERVKKAMKLTAKEYPRMDLIYGQELDIRISRNCIDRAMQLMNHVINWVKEKGYRISKRNRESYIIIYEQEVAIKLRERTTRVSNNSKYSFNSFDYEPTGKLYFKIGRWSREVEFKEGSRSLEEQLPVMFSRIEEMAKIDHELHLKHEAEREIERRATELRKQKEERCEKELKQFKRLLQESERWNKAQILRQYIAAYEAQLGSYIAQEEIERIAWAKEKTDWYDPSINKSDEDLELADRDTLTMEKKSSYW